MDEIEQHNTQATKESGVLQKIGNKNKTKQNVHTECDMIRSMTIWEVWEEAKEKGLPETVADSSTSPAMSSRMMVALEEKGGSWAGEEEEERALETSTEEALQERDKNSIGSRGVSGGRSMMVGPSWNGSGLAFSISGLLCVVVDCVSIYSVSEWDCNCNHEWKWREQETPIKKHTLAWVTVDLASQDSSTAVVNRL